MSATLLFVKAHAFQALRHAGHILLDLLGCFLIADFITGLVHWWEDAYAQPHWAVLGPLVAEPNLLHHRDPRAMTRLPWWRNVDVPVVAGALALGIFAAFHALTWQILTIVALTSLTNLVHRWAHQNPAENGPFITWLQAKGLIQSRAHHALHHRWPRKSHYCPLTNVLNPVLERLDFWHRMERAILRLSGLRRRREPRSGQAA